MRRALAILLLAGVAALLGCDSEQASDAQTPSEQLREESAAGEQASKAADVFRSHAERHGKRQARGVIFVAQELTQLHPHSERSKRSREARELLDEIVPRETSEESQ